MTEAAATLPLAGVTVLELSHAIMGPSCGMILGDLGAEVIKLEPVPAGDRTRTLKGVGIGFFGYYGRNKKSLAIDLKSEACRDVVDRLIKKADVLIENFAPGSMDRMGLGWQRTSALNPRLIYCSLKGFLSGPYEHRRALDEIAQMMSGLAYMTGPPGKPSRAGTSVIDVLGGMSGVIGILCALREREATGRGQLVKAGLFEAAAFIMGQHMVQYAITGEAPRPMSVPVRAWGVYDIFRSADDKMIFIGAVTDTQWLKFCEVFGRDDLAKDARLGSNADRVQSREWLIPMLEGFFRQFPTDELVAKCEQAELAFGPVNQPQDLLDDPHLNAGGHLVETRLPSGIDVRVPRLPIELGERWFSARANPPLLGEHAREVLASVGLDDAEIDGLIAAGRLVVTENSRQDAADD